MAANLRTLFYVSFGRNVGGDYPSPCLRPLPLPPKLWFFSLRVKLRGEGSVGTLFFVLPSSILPSVFVLYFFFFFCFLLG